MVKYIKRELSTKRKFPSQETSITLLDNNKTISIDNSWEFLDISLERESETSIKLLCKFTEERMDSNDLNFQEHSFKYLISKLLLNQNDAAIPLTNSIENYSLFLE